MENIRVELVFRASRSNLLSLVHSSPFYLCWLLVLLSSFIFCTFYLLCIVARWVPPFYFLCFYFLVFLIVLWTTKSGVVFYRIQSAMNRVCFPRVLFLCISSAQRCTKVGRAKCAPVFLCTSLYFGPLF